MKRRGSRKSLAAGREQGEEVIRARSWPELRVGRARAGERLCRVQPIHVCSALSRVKHPEGKETLLRVSVDLELASGARPWSAAVLVTVLKGPGHLLPQGPGHGCSSVCSALPWESHRAPSSSPEGFSVPPQRRNTGPHHPFCPLNPFNFLHRRNHHLIYVFVYHLSPATGKITSRREGPQLSLVHKAEVGPS